MVSSFACEETGSLDHLNLWLGTDGRPCGSDTSRVFSAGIHSLGCICGGVSTMIRWFNFVIALTLLALTVPASTAYAQRDAGAKLRGEYGFYGGAPPAPPCEGPASRRRRISNTANRLRR